MLCGKKYPKEAHQEPRFLDFLLECAHRPSVDFGLSHAPLAWVPPCAPTGLNVVLSLILFSLPTLGVEM